MKNKTAGNVVEIIYNDVANGPQRNSMLQEFLDNEFLVFKVITMDLDLSYSI